MALTYLGLEELPRLFDIVWCRFPEHTKPNEPAVKVRPALVRLSAMDQATGTGLLEVAYGTTNIKQEKRRLDLIIMNSVEIDDTGLRQATRFDLDQIVRLPWCREYFRPPNGVHDVRIGKLTLALQDRVRRLAAIRQQLAQLQAERATSSDEPTDPQS